MRRRAACAFDQQGPRTGPAGTDGGSDPGASAADDNDIITFGLFRHVAFPEYSKR
jgi:hypothetical protein